MKLLQPTAHGLAHKLISKDHRDFLVAKDLKVLMVNWEYRVFKDLKDL
jgi:hypothetical protein